MVPRGPRGMRVGLEVGMSKGNLKRTHHHENAVQSTSIMLQAEGDEQINI